MKLWSFCGKSKMREDLVYGLPFHNGGNDFDVFTLANLAAVEIDIKDSFEKLSPTKTG